MNFSKGYYSVIQYCPDLGRFESANVGVLLFCPEQHFLQALTSGHNSRIIRFFGSEGHDWKRINMFKRGLEDRLQKEAAMIKSVEDLEQFIALRANVLQITSPNSMKVCDPEQDLRDLFEEIIGEPARPKRQRSLRHYIDEKLSGSGLEKKVVRDVKVAVPVLQKEVEIPFGYQNGRFNLINPVRFGDRIQNNQLSPPVSMLLRDDPSMSIQILHGETCNWSSSANSGRRIRTPQDVYAEFLTITASNFSRWMTCQRSSMRFVARAKKSTAAGSSCSCLRPGLGL
jgi:hypothetical protein